MRIILFTAVLAITSLAAAGCACNDIGCGEVTSVMLHPELAETLKDGPYWLVAADEGSEFGCTVTVKGGVMTPLVAGGCVADEDDDGDPIAGSVRVTVSTGSEAPVRVTLFEGDDIVVEEEHTPTTQPRTQGSGVCALECGRRAIVLGSKSSATL